MNTKPHLRLRLDYKTPSLALVGVIAALALMAVAPSALAAPPEHPHNPTLSHAGFAAGCGATVDDNGFLYAADFGTVNVYDPTGAFVTNFASPEGAVCDLAVDSSGDVYVQDYLSTTYKLNPSTPGTVTGSTTFDPDPDHGGGSGAFDTGFGTAVAIDPTDDDVYVSHGDHLTRWNSDGTMVTDTIGTGVGGANFTGLDVFGQNGDIYANSGGTIHIFDPDASLTDPDASFDGSDSPTGAMSGDENIAVDQKNGRVLVYDATNNVVNEFEATGAFLAQIENSFSDGFPSGVAVDRSGGANDGSVYVVHAPGVDAFGALPAPTHPHNPTLSHAGFAAGCGATVDDNGFLYAADFGTVNVYDPTGAFVTNFASPEGAVCDLAVDSSGDVYVQDYLSTTYKLNPSTPGTVTGSTTFDPDPDHGGGSGAFDTGFGTAVAIDPTDDDVYVSHGDHLTRWNSDGTMVTDTIGTGVGGANFTGLDVFGQNGDIYANSGGTIHIFDPDASLTDPDASFDGSDSPTGAMSGDENIAVDQKNGRVLVYDATNNVVNEFEATGAFLAQIENSFSDGFPSGVAVDRSGGANDGSVYVVHAPGVDAFGPLAFGAAPATATTDPADPVGHTTATLHGSLDPGDDPLVDDCYFDWGTDTSYGQTADCVPAEPYSDPTDVTADLSGLAPGETYHFRLHVNGSVSGPDDGDDQSFTTEGFVRVTDPATAVHHRSAMLNGHFDPEGDPALAVTDCSFDWVEDAQFDIDQFASADSVDCEEGDSFAGAASVTGKLGFLTPGTTYHYRLHLDTFAAGEFTAADVTFTPTFFPVEQESIAVFGPDGTDATTFATGGGVRSLTFNQTDRELYAFDVNAPGIYGFDASAPPAYPQLPGFDPLTIVAPGNQSAIAVDNTALPASAGNLYLSSQNEDLLYGFDSTGALLGGPSFPIDPATPGNPGAPDGSPKDLCGAAVDSTGDLWVANRSTNRLLRYSSAGAFEASVNVSAELAGAVCSITFDSADNLYLLATGSTWRFTAVSGYTAATLVDSSGALALAVDPSNDRLYLAHESNVTEHDSTGAFLATLATGIFQASFRAVTVDATNHHLYVADQNGATGNQIRVFGPATPLTPPTLTPGDATAITGDSATLHAKVDPEGFEVTNCHFEYLTDAAFQANPANDRFVGAAEVPCDPDPGSGSGDVDVSADLADLNGGTSYRFRIVAANATPGGSAQGPAQSFDSPGPRITATQATEISESDAKLKAQVNPSGQSTSYHFEYVTDAELQADGFDDASSAPAAPAAIGSGNSAVAIGEQISGLDPATTYHFRAVAQSSAGTNLGPQVTFTTYGPPPDFSGDDCGNDAFRTGASADLPDCRAYEQASPVGKHGANLENGFNVDQAASTGDRVTFFAQGGLPTTGGASELSVSLASRSVSGWSTNGVLPQTPSGYDGATAGFSDDLSASLSHAGSPSGQALYFGDSTAGTWQQILAHPDCCQESLAAFADDPQHLIFESPAAMAAGAVPAVPNLYELDHGALTLAGRVPAFPATSCDDAPGGDPDCVPAPGGSFAGPYQWFDSPDLDLGGATKKHYVQDTLSDDGSRVFFTERGTGRLYMRDDGTRTVQINVSQAASPDPNGHKPAAFMAATPDGDKVFFTSCEKLTDGSTAVSTAANTCTTSSQGQDLYSYDASSGELTDLTVDTASNPLGADIRGVLGATADGDGVYFVADGDLDATGSAVAGSCASACNLYLSLDGDLSFVTRLGDDTNWRPRESENILFGNGVRTSRVTADGVLLLRSTTRLTTYDNTEATVDACDSPQGQPQPCREVYRFDPAASGGSGELICVSCSPTGAPPTGDAALESRAPRSDGLNVIVGRPILSRNISADGNRIFFESADKLVPADTNADDGCPFVGSDRIPSCLDAYEWEAEGTGSCDTATANGGCLYLLSTGQSDEPSFLGDISASGDDAFIFTADRLVPQDTDDLVDIYDARVGGGLAAQHQASPPPCAGDDCQGGPTPPPADPGSGTSAPTSPGNQGTDKTPAAKTCKKNQKLKDGRCVKKKKRKRKGGRK